jgi:HNH endonuclease
VDRGLEEQVWRRADSCCEYCHFAAEFAEYSFHIDHIIAEKHGGETDSENLALEYFYCNTSKEPNIAGFDRETGDITPLFNTRKQAWHEHFRWRGPYPVGLTPEGRATVEVLNINEPDAVTLRRYLMAEGLYSR